MTAIRVDDDARIPIYVRRKGRRKGARFYIEQSMSTIRLTRAEARALIHVLADFIDYPEEPTP